MRSLVHNLQVLLPKRNKIIPMELIRRIFICCFFLIGITKVGFSQVLPAYPTANWKDVNSLRINVTGDCDSVDILAYGGDNTGAASNNIALNSAITFLKTTGNTGIVLFPPGTYLFTDTINLPDSIILKGNGAANTTLRFMMGGKGSLITVIGDITSDTTKIVGTALKNSYKLKVADATKFQVGDIVKLLVKDSDLIYSAWAYDVVGQIMEIKSIVGDSIEFKSSMRIQYSAFRNPYIRKLKMKKNVGISCLKIIRGDNVSDSFKYSNVVFQYTTNCWLSGVHSDSAFFAHVDLSNSYRNIIRSCYFTNAYEYGGDGRAYGIACQATSSENLIIDNIFKKLRHAMLLQTAANGNVFSFNYSRETFWVEGIFPPDVSGDIVCHGNYPFSNLFEHNVLQNLIVDNSHGINGPYNLFFRNRAENVGIYMNSGAGDSTSFIGNEVTKPGGGFYGSYSLAGNGNFAYGNNVLGNAEPPGTNSLADSTYYLSGKPDLIPGVWPSIGYPHLINSGSVPSIARYNSNVFTVCNPLVNYPLAIADQQHFRSVNIYPNPSTDKLSISLFSLCNETLTFTITSLDGKVMYPAHVSAKAGTNTFTLSISHMQSGFYLLNIRSAKEAENYSFIKK